MFELFKANYAHASVRRNIGHASYFLVLAFSFVSRIRYKKCHKGNDCKISDLMNSSCDILQLSDYAYTS